MKRMIFNIMLLTLVGSVIAKENRQTRTTTKRLGVVTVTKRPETPAQQEMHEMFEKAYKGHEAEVKKLIVEEARVTADIAKALEELSSRMSKVDANFLKALSRYIKDIPNRMEEALTLQCDSIRTGHELTYNRMRKMHDEVSSNLEAQETIASAAEQVMGSTTEVIVPRKKGKTAEVQTGSHVIGRTGRVDTTRRPVIQTRTSLEDRTSEVTRRAAPEERTSTTRKLDTSRRPTETYSAKRK